MIAWVGRHKYRVTVRFEDGPLAGITHSWRTDRDPPSRIPSEWGTYVRRCQERKTFSYFWEAVRSA